MSQRWQVRSGRPAPGGLKTAAWHAPLGPSKPSSTGPPSVTACCALGETKTAQSRRALQPELSLLIS